MTHRSHLLFALTISSSSSLFQIFSSFSFVPFHYLHCLQHPLRCRQCALPIPAHMVSRAPPGGHHRYRCFRPCETDVWEGQDPLRRCCQGLRWLDLTAEGIFTDFNCNDCYIIKMIIVRFVFGSDLLDWLIIYLIMFYLYLFFVTILSVFCLQ